jgi:hypothetical protein
MTSEAETSCPCAWTGDELGVGTGVSAEWGWRVVSEVLSLDELMAVADGLFEHLEVAGWPLPAIPDVVYIVASEEEATRVAHLLAEERLWNAALTGVPLISEVLFATTPEQEAAVQRAIAGFAKRRALAGGPAMEVFDLRDR